MNRLVLSALLVERGATRYTPAGLPALDLRLQHAATVTEDGLPRKVALEIKAVALGEISGTIRSMGLGASAVFAGFLAPSRNARGLLFHITSVDAEVAAAPMVAGPDIG